MRVRAVRDGDGVGGEAEVESVGHWGKGSKELLEK
jgi:hypothetical protein